jgi:hypothetical protein
MGLEVVVVPCVGSVSGVSVALVGRTVVVPFVGGGVVTVVPFVGGGVVTVVAFVGMGVVEVGGAKVAGGLVPPEHSGTFRGKSQAVIF